MFTKESASNFTKVKKLGAGSFGTVWLVRSSKDGSTSVMKEVTLKGLPPSEKQATLNEVKILKQLQHPNIIRYKDAFVDPTSRVESLSIIMEHASGGDLHTLIEQRRKSGGRFSEAEVLGYLYQMTAALSYCHHEVRLLHRDLKPANVFLDANKNVKLGDFGISKILPFSQAKAMTQCGTPLYMSPEMCAGKPYTAKSDVWALGCVAYELMALEAPWVQQMGRGGPAGGLQGLMRRISSGALDIHRLRGRYSDGLCAILGALLAKEPERRPALHHLLTWPLLASAAPTPATPAPAPAAASSASPQQRPQQREAWAPKPPSAASKPVTPEYMRGGFGRGPTPPSAAAAAARVLQRSFRLRGPRLPGLATLREASPGKGGASDAASPSSDATTPRRANAAAAAARPAAAPAKPSVPEAWAMPRPAAAAPKPPQRWPMAAAAAAAPAYPRQQGQQTPQTPSIFAAPRRAVEVAAAAKLQQSMRRSLDRRRRQQACIQRPPAAPAAVAAGAQRGGGFRGVGGVGGGQQQHQQAQQQQQAVRRYRDDEAAAANKIQQQLRASFDRRRGGGRPLHLPAPSDWRRQPAAAAPAAAPARLAYHNPYHRPQAQPQLHHHQQHQQQQQRAAGRPSAFGRQQPAAPAAAAAIQRQMRASLNRRRQERAVAAGSAAVGGAVGGAARAAAPPAPPAHRHRPAAAHAPPPAAAAGAAARPVFVSRAPPPMLAPSRLARLAQPRHVAQPRRGRAGLAGPAPRAIGAF